MKAVIQCGGKGTRLRPYTSVLPKPLMPIGSRPVLELLLKWLRRNGIREVFVTTGYLGHLIRSFCGDGEHSSNDRSLGYPLSFPHQLRKVGMLAAVPGACRELEPVTRLSHISIPSFSSLFSEAC